MNALDSTRHIIIDDSNIKVKQNENWRRTCAALRHLYKVQKYIKLNILFIEIYVIKLERKI